MPDYKSHIPKPVFALAIVCTMFGGSGLLRAIAITGFNAEEAIAASPDGVISEDTRQMLMLLFAGLVRQMLMLVAGLSLFLFKPWSRLLALIFAAYAIGYSATAFVFSLQFIGEENGPTTGSLAIETVIQLILPVAVFLVLMNGDIIAAFKRGSRMPDAEAAE